MLDGFIISLSWVALVLGGLCWGEWVNSAQMRRVETKKRSKTLQVKSNFCRSFQSKSGEQSTFTKQPIYHCKWTQFTNCHDEWANGFLTTYNLLSTLESSLFVFFAVFFLHFTSLVSHILFLEFAATFRRKSWADRSRLSTFAFTPPRNGEHFVNEIDSICMSKLPSLG